jgi:VanZ family protein
MRKAGIAAGWAWAAAIVWLSLAPSEPDFGMEHGDKLGHLASYVLLMFWFSQLYVETRTRVAYAVAFVAMGVALELLQSLVPSRVTDVADMAANALGVLLGWAAALVLARIRFS